MAMRVYFTQAVQEKYRQTGDVFGEGEQYARGVTTVTATSSYLDLSDTGSTTDICPNMVGRVNILEGEIANLMARAANFRQLATQMRQQAATVGSGGAGYGFGNQTTGQSQGLVAQAQDMDARAAECDVQAAAKNQEITKLKDDYPQCFN
jgi:hypothetical protein